MSSGPGRLIGQPSEQVKRVTITLIHVRLDGGKFVFNLSREIDIICLPTMQSLPSESGFQCVMNLITPMEAKLSI